MNSNIELFKIEFREYCVRHLIIRWIKAVFSSAGIQPVEISLDLSGQRRLLVESYYASLDWNKIESVRMLLTVVTNTLRLGILEDEQKQALHSLCAKCGFTVDSSTLNVHLTSEGVGSQVKNLIFAADGPKPEIVLSDSVSNHISIVKNEEFCLIYTEPILSHGLLWVELVQWWRSITENWDDSDKEVGRDLFRRLRKSLGSSPEEILWKTYFQSFYHKLGENLPALIPQVYLHYDPYTLKQLRNEKRLYRQRMDFLLLLSDRKRIIIEIDGRQHYSIDGEARPKLYSEMVAEDRELKLAGYEVYRFGGYELLQDDASEKVERFFHNLFIRHAILQDTI